MDLLLQINRGLIALNALILERVSKSRKSKRVLIVFQQIFGDSIVIQNTLSEYSKMFPKSDGWEVHFLARPSVLSFMKDTMPLPNDILMDAIDFKRFLKDYSYYRLITKKYRDTVDTIIVPGTSLSAEIFSCSVNAERKVGLVRSFPVKKPLIIKTFYDRAYTDTVVPDKEDMMLQRHRLLLNFLGASDYKAKLPMLLPKDRIIEGDYVVCCPGASKMEKCWPSERFITVIDYIIERYGLPVHLCGGAGEEVFERLIEKGTKYPDMVISHIGKTDFSDWSAIVQHAELVLGNDSATMHLAAASRRKAVCIAGVYDKFQFFPYKVDELAADDRLPVTIFKDMPCEWCRTIGYYAGYGNEECKKRIETGLCSSCIDLLTVEEVKNAINNLMEEKQEKYNNV